MFIQLVSLVHFNAKIQVTCHETTPLKKIRAVTQTFFCWEGAGSVAHFHGLHSTTTFSAM
jgi:hypothetical protein